jgi:hypothetical protein
MNEMEKNLSDQKNSYLQVHIPDNIDSYIKKGIEKAKHKRFRRRKVLKSSFAVAAALMVFVSSVRISPAFAAFISNIPGMEYVVQLIDDDRGLKLSVENEFMQPIGVSDQHEGITFTVDGIILDEGRLNVFYTIENQSEHRPGDIMEARLHTENGKQLEYTVSSGLGSKPTTSIIQNRLDFNLLNNRDKLPNSIILSVAMADVQSQGSATTTEQSFTNDQLLAPTWQVKIPIDHKKFMNMKEVFAVNKRLEVGGQTIFLKEITVYPTRIALDVEFDTRNTQKIFGFRGLTIENEKGEKLYSYQASITGENSQTIYFESNYFSKPKQLFVSGKHINALPKGKLNLTISLKDRQIISAPDDHVKLVNVKKDGEDLVLQLNVTGLQPWDNRGYNIVGNSFEDGSGKTYQVIPTKESSGFSTGSGQSQTQNIRIKAGMDYKDPLLFSITDYPSFISEEFKIQLK